jgi:hypothetical protein
MRLASSPILAAAALAALPVPALAEVQEASASGFTVGGELTLISHDNMDVWEALIRPGEWWSSEHSWSGDAANMTLVPVAGGCFCEVLPGQGANPPGSVEHMRVIHAAPNSLLRMQGALGPLQSEAVTGVLTIELAYIMVTGLPTDDIGNGATITWTYVVGGNARFGMEEMAPAVDAVVAQQMQRLAAHLQAPGP